MFRPTQKITGGNSHLLADLNALVLYALLLGMFSILLIGGLIGTRVAPALRDA